ncbi:hypothetical protein BB559_004755 [Furculomyces boomerangus]|uniref:Uncharacterized protein n=1 Tax=Furculomyces boomerangus TaxID=61424 RepID=A0A2T9YCV8_9FUNG|nr:hypothetical protein BB559_004755 [Furculomyces boomerangus]
MNAHQAHIQNDKDNEALKRKPVQFENEVRTKDDYKNIVEIMRTKSSKDAQVISRVFNFVGGFFMIVFILFTYNSFKAAGTKKTPKLPLIGTEIKTENPLVVCELFVVSLQAAIFIIGKPHFGIIGKLVVFGLVLSDMYIVVNSFKHGWIEMIFWLLPTILLILSGITQAAIVNAANAIDEYEKKVMKNFKDE